MGLWSSICLVSDDKSRCPQGADLRSIADYLGATRLDFLVEFESPYRWEEPESDIGSQSGISVFDASQALDASDGKTLFVMFSPGVWIGECESELTELPLSLTDRFVPYEVSMFCGKASIPTLDQSATAAESQFIMKLSGSGCPTDSFEYLTEAIKTNVIKDLVAFLETQIGSRMLPYITLH